VRLIFEGRITDIIKTGGINVSPSDIERVISQHPDIKEAVVVGLPEDETDEVVGAAVKPTAGSSLSAEEVVSFAANRMASYKDPAGVVVQERGFPRTGTGKVRKVEVRECLPEETGRED